MMWGLPTWVWMGSPIIGFAMFFFVIRKARQVQDDARARGLSGGQALYEARHWHKALFASMFVLMLGILVMIGATGRHDEDELAAQCAKHGMAPFRQAFGHSGCLNSKTHQPAYFEEIR